jgi:TRAP-type C4-dicarboxylate transport system permease small subunit
MIDRCLDRGARALLVVAAALGFLLSFLVCADVIGRVIFNAPVKGTPEMVSMAIVIIAYLQAAYAIHSGGMIGVDAVTIHLPARVQSFLAAFGALLGAGLFALVLWGSIDGAAHAWNSGEYEGEGALRIPVWPARFIIVLGCALASLSYALLALRCLAAGLRGEAPAGYITSH